MKAIVTGGAGFIGSHVARILSDSGVSVLVIDDLSGGFVENVPKNAILLEMSITDSRVKYVIKDFQPDLVFHLAAYAAEGLSYHIPSFNYENNLVGTANVLNGAYMAGAKRFVFTSSIATYGHPKDERPFIEGDRQEPVDPYGIAKLACEQHIRSFRHYHGGPDYVIFRPHNVFGPNQNIADPFRNVVGIFMRQCLDGKPLTIFGDGIQTRSFSYIDVVAQAIVSSVLKNGEIQKMVFDNAFNIGGDESMSVKDLALLVSNAMGVKPDIQFLPARIEVKHAHCDHRIAKSVFRDEYKKYHKSIIEGIYEMAQWVKANKIPKTTPCPSPIEIRDHLPPSWSNLV